MSEPMPNSVLPLADIAEILYARSVGRTLYLRVRSRWFTWLEETGQPHQPISLSPNEETSMDFIDYQLSSEEKEACAVWVEAQAGQYLEMPNDVVHKGYRITFTFDEKNQCIVVTLIGRAKDCPNFNKAMSTRHSSVNTALMWALYKQIVIFNHESWGETDAETLFG